MIIATFDLRIRSDVYTFVDREAVDSAVEKLDVDQRITKQLLDSQQDAMCANLVPVLPDQTELTNFGFGCWKNSSVVGAYLIASNVYLDGPWADLNEWQETNPGAVIHATGRHMPAFSSWPDVAGLPAAEEQEVSSELSHHFLSQDMVTVNGNGLRFTKISWAIFKDRTDPRSLRDVGIHNAIVGHSKLKATEVADPNNSALTRVDVELL